MEENVEKKSSKVLLYILIVILALVAGFFGGKYYFNDEPEKETPKEEKPKIEPKENNDTKSGYEMDVTSAIIGDLENRLHFNVQGLYEHIDTEYLKNMTSFEYKALNNETILQSALFYSEISGTYRDDIKTVPCSQKELYNSLFKTQFVCGSELISSGEVTESPIEEELLYYTEVNISPVALYLINKDTFKNNINLLFGDKTFSTFKSVDSNFISCAYNNNDYICIDSQGGSDASSFMNTQTYKATDYQTYLELYTYYLPNTVLGTEELNDYINTNKDNSQLVKKYKHTFTKNDDGTYYWSKTEQI